MPATLDPVSRLLLDEAALEPSPPSPGPTRATAPTFCQISPPRDRYVAESGYLAESSDRAAPSAAHGPILVIDDPGLANQLHATGHPVRAHCDDLRDERLLGFAPLDALDEAGLDGVVLVLLRLPKSLGMLQDYAQRVAAFANPEVRLLAGGREKHLTRSMNDVLAGSFAEVRASLGRQKSRVLHACDPVPGDLGWPHVTRVDDLTLVSHAGAFAADRLDGGTRLLLQALSQQVPPPPPGAQLGRSDGGSRAIDLGCGTGILATWLARRGYEVVAVDVSRAACASAGDTASANGVRIEVRREDHLDQAAGSVDLAVCNPPFHRGTAKDSSPGFDLIRSAVPALAPGAELWTVFNSHLPYLPFLRAEVGRTTVAARDRHYTVTRSRRPE